MFHAKTETQKEHARGEPAVPSRFRPADRAVERQQQILRESQIVLGDAARPVNKRSSREKSHRCQSSGSGLREPAPADQNNAGGAEREKSVSQRFGRDLPLQQKAQGVKNLDPLRKVGVREIRNNLEAVVQRVVARQDEMKTHRVEGDF